MPRRSLLCLLVLSGCGDSSSGAAETTGALTTVPTSPTAPTSSTTDSPDPRTTTDDPDPNTTDLTTSPTTLTTTGDPAPCTPATCSDHGTCAATPDGLPCVCDDGFTGDHCEAEDPDPEGPLSTEPRLLLEEDSFYPRVIELDDGTILAAVVAPQQSGRLGGTILESTNGGVDFTVVGHIDGDLSLGGLCCATLYQLPQPLGALPAGSLLWAASVGADNPNAPMAIPAFASTDRGRTWSFLSNVVVAGVPRAQGGLWEPEFSQLGDGSLVCHYSDETDPAHSQKLVARRSLDGLGWPEQRDIVRLPAEPARPGMPVVRRPPTGPYRMSFEICGTDGCATHLRFSDDGWNWGDPADPGLRPATLTGLHFRHAPTLAFSDAPGNGRFFLVGQLLFSGDSQAGPSGTVLLANTEGGYGAWYELPAPVPVPDAYDNFCPNYSAPILPLEHGRVVLELASRWDGDRCRTYYARGPLRGTGDASGLTDGAAYRFTALNSNFCLDVVDGSPNPGANIRQWDCNGSDAQRFTFSVQPNGDAHLINIASGLCVTAATNSPDAGANVEQQPCDAATTWRLENVGLGYWRAVHSDTGVCLDVAGGSPDLGANVQQWTCNDLAPQIWRLTP